VGLKGVAEKRRRKIEDLVRTNNRAKNWKNQHFFFFFFILLANQTLPRLATSFVAWEGYWRGTFGARKRSVFEGGTFGTFAKKKKKLLFGSFFSLYTRSNYIIDIFVGDKWDARGVLGVRRRGREGHLEDRFWRRRTNGRKDGWMD